MEKKINTILLLLLIYSSSIFAIDTLRLATTNYPPWRMVKDGQHTGIDIEIWNIIAQKMDVSLEFYKVTNLEDLYGKIQTGEVDATVSLLRTKEREEFVDFIDVAYKVKRKINFYVKKGRAYTLMSKDDLANKRIGVVGPGLLQTIKLGENQITMCQNNQKAFQLLDQDSIDAFLCTEWMADIYLIQSKLVDKYEKASYHYHVYNDLHPAYYGLSKKSGFNVRKKEIENILRELITNGTVSGIINDYLPDYSDYFNYATPEDVGMSSQKLNNIKIQAQSWVDQDKIIGAVMLVLRDDKIVLNETVGWSDKENKIPMYPDHIFRMGSMTKPLTGTAILKLMEAGKLQLTDKASKYVPSFNNPKCKDITIFQLLSGTAGFSANNFYKTYSKYDNLKEAVDALANVGPTVEPGTEFEFVSEGFSVLGIVIENITGMPAEKYIHKQILEPLGMKNSFCDLEANDNRKSDIAACYAKESGKWNKIWDNSMSMPMPYFTAATGFYSTALDYARFLNMMLHNGSFQGKQIISPSSVRLATSPHSTYVYDSDHLRKNYYSFDYARYYGLGWWVYDDKFMPLRSCFSLGTFEVQGMWATCAFVDPQENLIAVFLTQSARSWNVYWKSFPNMVYGSILHMEDEK